MSTPPARRATFHDVFAVREFRALWVAYVLSASLRTADVIARMHAIDAGLPRKDGVAIFNRLYLEVTLAVDSARSKVATQQATITRIGHQIAAHTQLRRPPPPGHPRRASLPHRPRHSLALGARTPYIRQR